MDPSSSDSMIADESSFPFLYARHRATVRSALRMLGVDGQNLDDAVQDVFTVLHRRLRDYEQDRSLTNWLWGIARGVASGYRRSARRRSRLHGALAPFGPGSSEPMRRIEASDALDAMFSSLDADKCAVLILADVEGRSGPEIADRLGVNLNTVYARLRAARRGLREAASRHGHERWTASLFLWGSKAWPLAPACAAVGLTMLMEGVTPSSPEPLTLEVTMVEEIDAPLRASTPVPVATRAGHIEPQMEPEAPEVEIIDLTAPRVRRRARVQEPTEDPRPIDVAAPVVAEPVHQPEGLWVTVPVRAQAEALFEVRSDFLGELTALVGE